METYLSSRPYRIQSLLFSFPWELFKNIKRNFESRIVARVMKILFLSWGDFFSNVVLLFLRVVFYMVLARFHSCFHFFIMVCLTKIVGLFYNWPQKTWYVATPWFRIWANALTDKLSFMSLSAKQTILKVLLLSKNSIFHIWIFLC